MENAKDSAADLGLERCSRDFLSLVQILAPPVLHAFKVSDRQRASSATKMALK